MHTFSFFALINGFGYDITQLLSLTYSILNLNLKFKKNKEEEALLMDWSHVKGFLGSFSSD